MFERFRASTLLSIFSKYLRRGLTLPKEHAMGNFSMTQQVMAISICSIDIANLSIPCLCQMRAGGQLTYTRAHGFHHVTVKGKRINCCTMLTNAYRISMLYTLHAESESQRGQPSGVRQAKIIYAGTTGNTGIYGKTTFYSSILAPSKNS